MQTVFRFGTRVAHAATEVDGNLWTLCGRLVLLNPDDWMILQEAPASCAPCKRAQAAQREGGGSVSINLDLGNGFRVKTFIANEHGEETGMVLEHQSRLGVCRHAVYWSGPRATHRLESREPLTLSPSLQCECPFHGFIQNGRWIAA